MSGAPFLLSSQTVSSPSSSSSSSFVHNSSADARPPPTPRHTYYICNERFFWFPAINTNEYGEVYVQPYLEYNRPETKRRIHNLFENMILTRKNMNSGYVQYVTVDNILQNNVQKHEESEFKNKSNRGKIYVVKHFDTAEEEYLLMCHDEKLVQLVKSKNNEGGNVGQNADICAGGFEICKLAAGSALAAVDILMNEQSRYPANAFVLCNPPGHHATPEKAMGFCIFNNLAIGVKYAMKKYDLKRTAIVDMDVHHGNGTQEIFYRDSSVLFLSIHQDNLFPKGSGSLDENGEGEGLHFNINVPLPPGSGRGAYQAAFKKIVIRSLDIFKADMLFVSCGFDASFADPLGNMILSSKDFRYMTDRLVEAADRHSRGRIIFCQEGGYSEEYVPFCAAAVMEGLTQNEDLHIDDPYLAEVEGMGYQNLQQHQNEVLKKAEVLVEKLEKEMKQRNEIQHETDS